MCNFETKVLNGLSQCSVDLNKSINMGVAVSGGADSVSLLISLAHILKSYELPLFVITVNHNIRPKEETYGDAQYVVELCEKLKKENHNVFVKVVELDRGAVTACDEKRKAGIEEAARYLRYNAFNDFIKENNLDFLCLAHNQNDNYETLLMRFLQGSSTEGLRGILPVRNKYIRPLLNISRNDIEEYLIQQNIGWRTDKTNLDESYLRNKIRMKLVPFLNSQFENWQIKLDMSAQRAIDDYEIIEEAVSRINIPENNSFSVESFNAYSKALQKRVLLKMCNKVSSLQRIPYSFICDVCNTINKEIEFSKFCEDVEITVKNNQLFVKKYAKKQTDLCFSDIINKEGLYTFPFGYLKVTEEKDVYNFIFENKDLSYSYDITVCKLPVCVRNYRTGDEVLCNEGHYKKLQDVFTDWHVNQEYKPLIPLVEDLSSNKREILCVVGSIFEYKNWILRDSGKKAEFGSGEKKL